MAIKKSIGVIFDEIKESIDLDENDIVTIVTSIKQIHLFDDVLDFRQEQKTTYKLSDILLLAFLVILERGKQTFYYIASYIKINHIKYEKLGLIKDNNYPSHDTFRRIFSLLDEKSLKETTIDRLYEFLLELEKNQKGLVHICVDGKTVNGTGRNKDTNNPHENYNVMNVYSSTYGTCIYSEVIEHKKSSEIPAAQRILSSFNLKNVVVTADAIHCQRNTCKAIKGQSGHYVLNTKDNQELLKQDIEAKFNNPRNKKKIITIEEDNTKISILKLPSNYDNDGFVGLRSFVKLESHKRKKPCIRYFITDLVKPDDIVYAINSRWSIEIFHKLKDDFLHEDEFRCFNKRAVKNIVTMNNLISQLIKIYVPLSEYDLHDAKIAMSSRPMEEVSKLLTLISTKELKEKMLKVVK